MSVFGILGKLLRLFEPQLAHLYIGDRVLPSFLMVMGIKLGQRMAASIDRDSLEDCANVSVSHAWLL